jgi:hypothetical protein
MHTLLSLLAVAGLLACSGGTAVAKPQAAPKAAAAPTVELAELKFYAGNDLGMQLHADGHVLVMTEANWADIGRIATDGTITGPDGKARGHITADGSVVGPSGKAGPFHLEGTTLVIGDKRFSIDDKGMLQGSAQAPMRIEGATTPGLKRTALVLLASIMTSGKRG